MFLSTSDKRRIQEQFDSFCKKVLRGETSDYRKELARLADNEISIFDLTDKELNRLCATTECPLEDTLYQVSGFDIAVHNDLLAEALDLLPERKREIISQHELPSRHVVLTMVQHPKHRQLQDSGQTDG